MENVISQLKKFFDERHISQKEVAKKLGLPPITGYTARYTWATLAASIDVPIEVISQALGHSYGLAVTLGYIMPDRRKMDEANRRVLDLVALKRNSQAEACDTLTVPM